MVNISPAPAAVPLQAVKVGCLMSRNPCHDGFQTSERRKNNVPP